MPTRPGTVSPGSGMPDWSRGSKHGFPPSSTITSISVPALDFILFLGKSPCQEAYRLAISPMRLLDFHALHQDYGR
jgi:hypothetical protein